MIPSKNHTSAFVHFVNTCKKGIKETNVDAIRLRQLDGETFCLIDVREESEWAQGHLPGAIHLGKGVIERDIENIFPDPSIELLLYCGGGYRSAIAAHNLKQMGYTNVVSVDGGFRDWVNKGFPIEQS